MAIRAIWTGGISFGLVFIPVKLYSASSSDKLSFDMLRKKDLCPIKYVRVCKSTGEEVPWDEIVKGYEYQKGDYIVLMDEDFEKVNVKKRKTIDIVQFVDQKDIPVKYFEKPYFLEPTPEAAKTYILLREALKRSGKAGLAKYVIRNKEHLGLLSVEGDAIYLMQMRFHDELRSPDQINVPEGKVSKQEVDMALQIIKQLEKPFKAEDFKDTYKEELQKIIDKKIKKQPVRKKKVKEPEPTGPDDLLKQLKKSLETAEAQN